MRNRCSCEMNPVTLTQARLSLCLCFAQNFLRLAHRAKARTWRHDLHLLPQGRIGVYSEDGLIIFAYTLCLCASPLRSTPLQRLLRPSEVSRLSQWNKACGSLQGLTASMAGIYSQISEGLLPDVMGRQSSPTNCLIKIASLVGSEEVCPIFSPSANWSSCGVGPRPWLADTHAPIRLLL
jgi:hypothetical protein